MILIPEKRIVLFEKIDPKTIIHNLFLEHLHKCKIMAIGNESSSTFYLTKNDEVLFELNRLSKIIFIMSDVAQHILFDACKSYRLETISNIDFELFSTFKTVISKTIKNSIKIDETYNYEVKITNSEEKEGWKDILNIRCVEVGYNSLFSPVQDIEEYIDLIMESLIPKLATE